jgi:hypothetical protein
MIDPSRWGEFVDRRAGIEDAKIRRCTCGSWVYGDHSCPVCGLVVDQSKTIPGSAA